MKERIKGHQGIERPRKKHAPNFSTNRNLHNHFRLEILFLKPNQIHDFFFGVLSGVVVYADAFLSTFGVWHANAQFSIGLSRFALMTVVRFSHF